MTTFYSDSGCTIEIPQTEIQVTMNVCDLNAPTNDRCFCPGQKIYDST